MHFCLFCFAMFSSSRLIIYAVKIKQNCEGCASLPKRKYMRNFRNNSLYTLPKMISKRLLLYSLLIVSKIALLTDIFLFSVATMPARFSKT